MQIVRGSGRLSFKIFINNVYRVLWDRTKLSRAFDAYDDMVKVLIDLLIGLDLIHPSLFISIVEEFARFAEYVGRKFYGQSFSAYDTWKSLCNEIPDEVCKQLKTYGFNHSFYIEQLMEERWEIKCRCITQRKIRMKIGAIL